MLPKGVVVCLAVLLVMGVAAVSFADGGNEDRVLSKVTFIHHRKAPVKPPVPGSGKKDDGSYSYIASGARWRAIEDVRLNPAGGENPTGALDTLIYDAVSAGMAEWETPGTASLAIFGSLTVDDTVTYDDGAYRGYNTISFGSYGDSNVIAITTVWGYFSGKPSSREIIEAHILFNDAYDWGDASVDSSLMDLQNIATHELGHWVGMDDLYQTDAIEETMYGYSTEGELKKRDLYKGDIAGVVKLYQ